MASSTRNSFSGLRGQHTSEPDPGHGQLDQEQLQRPAQAPNIRDLHPRRTGFPSIAGGSHPEQCNSDGTALFAVKALPDTMVSQEACTHGLLWP